MSPWKNLFKSKSDKNVESQAENCLQVELKELIGYRYHSSGLNFSSALSNRKKAHSAIAGGHLSPFKGRGLDFDEVRPYQPGDDIRNIDWNVTARTNRVHTKIFKEERERPVFIVADFRAGMRFATRGSLKSVQAARIAALSAWIAADDHNRIGGMIFSDQQQLEIRPQGGHKGVLKLFNLMTRAHEDLISERDRDFPTETRFDAINLFKRLKQVIKPGSLIVFLSDFHFLNRDNLQQMQFLARHNDFIATFVYDPLEVELPPPGQYAIATADEQPQIKHVDTSDEEYRNYYRRQFIQRDEFLLDNFNRMGIHYLRLATNDDPIKTLTQFLGPGLKKTRVAKNRF